MVGEGSHEQLVKDASLVHVQIIGHFVITPRCEATRVIIGGVETVTPS